LEETLAIGHTNFTCRTGYLDTCIPDGKVVNLGVQLNEGRRDFKYSLYLTGAESALLFECSDHSTLTSFMYGEPVTTSDSLNRIIHVMITLFQHHYRITSR
jgi:hypothetical protein